jgi:Kef-type K+ transport system membrane component KefB
VDLERLLVLLALVYAAAFVGREVAERLRMPGLVGEIFAGVVLGPAVLGAIDPHNEVLESLSELGVIFLLFSVGVETNISELRRVGPTSMAVGVAGIGLPFIMGAGFMFFRGSGLDQAIFLGAAMVATSVGITAQVLQERGKLTTREARIILAAAVIDDILALILLSIVEGITLGSLSLGSVAVLFLAALGFVLVVGELGRRLMRRFFPHIDRLKMTEPALGLAILVALALAASASQLGLAGIIGAFLAGVILGEGATTEHELEAKIQPLSIFFVPFFFIHVGALVELGPLTSPDGIGLVVVVVILAFIGKFVGCGLPALRLGVRSASIVGMGMTPRGEVGIIVATIGQGLGVIDAALYGVVVLMSIITSVLAPPLIMLLYRSADRAKSEASAPSAASEPGE